MASLKVGPDSHADSHVTIKLRTLTHIDLHTHTHLRIHTHTHMQAPTHTPTYTCAHTHKRLMMLDKLHLRLLYHLLIIQHINSLHH